MNSSPSSFSLSVEELLRQATWVRRVARALVQGHDRVEELEQETWVAALSHPPRHGGDLRRWFSAVTRNVSRHLLRKDATREHHERRSAEPLNATRDSNVAPAAGAMVARAEILQRIATAVLALEEPYRSALLARYFDELTPSEIARTLDVSVETVKTRLKRGLAQMRERLDSLRPDGTTLEAVLLPLFGPAVATAVPFGMKVAAFAAMLAIAGSITWIEMRPTQSTDEAMTSLASQPAAAAITTASPQHSSQEALSSREPSRSTAVPAPADSDTKARSKRQQPSARVAARVVFPEGIPAKGVRIRLEGGPLVDPSLDPGDRIVVEESTSDDGTFSIDFPIKAGFAYRLSAMLSGYARVAWNDYFDLESGRVYDLGDVALQRGGTIRARLVDRDGAPLKNARDWYVSATGPELESKDRREATFVTAKMDPATSSFILVDVAPGRNQLSAKWKSNQIDGATVDVESGRESTVDIVFPGHDLSRMIQVEISAASLAPPLRFMNKTAEVILRGSSGEWRRESRMPPVDNGLVCFEDLPDGTYSVEVNVKDAKPWRATGVTPGSNLDARIVGNASIHLRVIDGDSGDPIRRYSLNIVYAGVVTTERFAVLNEGDTPPKDGVFEGFWPWDQMLVVIAKGFAPGFARLFPVNADQVTDVTVRLAGGATISGTVFRSDGKTPAVGMKVRLDHRMDLGEDEINSPPVELGFAINDRKEATSDEQGEFEFANVSPGHYTLHVGEQGPLQTSIDDVEVTELEPRLENLDLVLPGRGFLVGSLITPPGADIGRMTLVAYPPGDDGRIDDDDLGGLLSDERAHSTAQADGSFRIGPLREGPNEVSLRLPDYRVPSTNLLLGGRAGPFVPLGTVTIVEGQETRAEFDLREKLPGRVRVAVSENGHPSVEAVVELVRAVQDSRSGEKHASYESVACGTVRGDGVATIENVPVGSVHCIVRAKDASWAWWSEVSIAVRPGADVESALEFTLFDGQFTVKDAKTGAFIANHEFAVARPNGELMDAAIGVKSDANGVVHLRLAPGHYAIADSMTMRDDYEGQAFDWTAEGAVKDSVTLEIVDLRELSK